jgi:hypothetical protein
MTPGGRSCVSRDVALPPERGVLRVALILGPDGAPEELILAPGRGEERRWKEVPEEGGLTLPPGALPGLIRALEYLQGVSDALRGKGGHQ